ncbi:Response regulator receiver domain-containing protein [Verrucomicrobium sp. GAS474]|uniref:response regulator n=1 Tax=Verrucomicrobium sp. GAS474 TaxID=1882831 RepID=UPI00087B4A01|nr:response regulator [Verrucomicrobium sp. GAS474]SDU25398.1 Response regulator receiver domain-containing protein [Verrucomicrobium sp. GAS474]
MAKILIIEDEAPFRTVLVRVLQEKGHTVTEAPDGTDALRLCQAHAFDLMITDLIMPNKEGIETIIEVRKHLPTLPIIAMSGGGRTGPHDLLTAAAALGAQATISKPFHIHELIALVETQLAASLK